MPDPPFVVDLALRLDRHRRAMKVQHPSLENPAQRIESRTSAIETDRGVEAFVACPVDVCVLAIDDVEIDTAQLRLLLSKQLAE